MKLFRHGWDRNLNWQQDLNAIADPALAATAKRLSRLGPQTVSRLAEAEIDQIKTLSPDNDPDLRDLYDEVNLRLETAVVIWVEAAARLGKRKAVRFFSNKWDLGVFATSTRLVSFPKCPDDQYDSLGRLSGFMKDFYLVKSRTPDLS